MRSGAGPAVNNRWVFVPTVTGKLIGYRVAKSIKLSNGMEKNEQDSPKDTEGEKSADDHQKELLKAKNTRPLTYQSKGRLMVRPLITRRSG